MPAPPLCNSMQPGSSLHRLGGVVTRNINHKRSVFHNDSLQALWGMKALAPGIGCFYDPRIELLDAARSAGIFLKLPPDDCSCSLQYNSHSAVLDEAKFLECLSTAAGSLSRAVVCVRLIRKAQRQFMDLESLKNWVIASIPGITAELNKKAVQRDAHACFDEPSITRLVQRKILSDDYFQSLHRTNFHSSEADLIQLQTLLEATRQPRTTYAPGSPLSPVISPNSPAKTTSPALKAVKEERDRLNTVFERTRPKPCKVTPTIPVSAPSYPLAAKMQSFVSIQAKTTEDALCLSLEETRPPPGSLPDGKDGGLLHPLTKVAPSKRAAEAIALRRPQTINPNDSKEEDKQHHHHKASVPNQGLLEVLDQLDCVQPTIVTDVWWDSRLSEKGTADPSPDESRAQTPAAPKIARRLSQSWSAPALRSQVNSRGEPISTTCASRGLDDISAPQQRNSHSFPPSQSFLLQPAVKSTQLPLAPLVVCLAQPTKQTREVAPATLVRKPAAPRVIPSQTPLGGLHFGLGAADAPLAIPAGTLAPDAAEIVEIPKPEPKSKPKAGGKGKEAKEAGAKGSASGAGSTNDDGQRILRGLADAALRDVLTRGVSLLPPPPALFGNPRLANEAPPAGNAKVGSRPGQQQLPTFGSSLPATALTATHTILASVASHGGGEHRAAPTVRPLPGHLSLLEIKEPFVKPTPLPTGPPVMNLLLPARFPPASFRSVPLSPALEQQFDLDWAHLTDMLPRVALSGQTVAVPKLDPSTGDTANLAREGSVEANPASLTWTPFAPRLKQLLWAQYPRLERMYRYLSAEDPSPGPINAGGGEAGDSVDTASGNGAASKAKEEKKRNTGADKKESGGDKKTSHASNTGGALPPADKKFWKALGERLPLDATSEGRDKRERLFQKFDANHDDEIEEKECLAAVSDLLGDLARGFRLDKCTRVAFDLARTSKPRNTITLFEFRHLLWVLREYFELWAVFSDILHTHPPAAPTAGAPAEVTSATAVGGSEKSELEGVSGGGGVNQAAATEKRVVRTWLTVAELATNAPFLAPWMLLPESTSNAAWGLRFDHDNDGKVDFDEFAVSLITPMLTREYAVSRQRQEQEAGREWQEGGVRVEAFLTLLGPGGALAFTQMQPGLAPSLRDSKPKEGHPPTKPAPVNGQESGGEGGARSTAGAGQIADKSTRTAAAEGASAVAAPARNFLLAPVLDAQFLSAARVNQLFARVPADPALSQGLPQGKFPAGRVAGKRWNRPTWVLALLQLALCRGEEHRFGRLDPAQKLDWFLRELFWPVVPFAGDLELRLRLLTPQLQSWFAAKAPQLWEVWTRALGAEPVPSSELSLSQWLRVCHPLRANASYPSAEAARAFGAACVPPSVRITFPGFLELLAMCATSVHADPGGWLAAPPAALVRALDKLLLILVEDNQARTAP
jgi:hypothetical protein